MARSHTPTVGMPRARARRVRRSPDVPSAARAAVGPHTWDDFVALPDDDRRELIEGELVEVEVPDLAHEHAVAKLVWFLTGWSEEHGGMVLASGYKVRISEARGVMPDVQVFRDGNVPGIDQNPGLARGRPDLSVEVISPSGRGYDRIIKLGYYASASVPEYWLVDPRAHVVERLVLRRGAYTSAEVLEGAVALAPETFPGLSIPLAKVWLPGPPPAPRRRASKKTPAQRSGR